MPNVQLRFARLSTNGRTPDPVPTSRILLLTDPEYSALIDKRIDASVRTSRIGAYRNMKPRNNRFPLSEDLAIAVAKNRGKKPLKVSAGSTEKL
jgi:hypothetical protein